MRRYMPCHNEQGNSFVVYVMMMLLMLGIFGLAVDTAINVYTRNAIQSALDTATRTAVQQTNIQNGRVVVNPVKAQTTAMQTYTKNRPGSGTSGGAMLVCQNVAAGQCFQVTRYSVGTDPKTGQQFIEFSVREKRNNLFLNMIGVDQQLFEVTSRARFAANLEQR